MREITTVPISALFVIIFGLLTVLTGLIIIIGVKRKWRIFLNPPSHIWILPIWPYALIKGTRYDKYIPLYNLILGIALIFVGLLFILISII